jgi:hypothetical protein
MDGTYNTNGEMRNAYEISVGKPEQNTWGNWKDNIKIELKDICFKEVDWMHFGQDRNSGVLL